ncbi:hypothetical protein WMELPLUS_00626 [Wolbachia endosymbiont of Drosophila melanogaster]|nr:hypothetical protein WMELPLUS_00450 [Wolbachia endosymbiont of Drosophila melanogaster]CAI5594112.1 hypothetical protein WMELPLUS_00464 [Wolbachia endosymbiont of Drosophila melanogaster]CAI5594262.1 hypothetical protein WMELPLUS_00626 [Wolbachia endosymbiont of Drosophila melanogaster]CAI5616936.1 hypothetical protein WMELCS112_00438 [Wolbachia endosymbiont of Drosophila melanogaster]CAI5616948.1 hypothetical protein WMELCS112_00452 [Wolbachia endosymbiont of Drosophila melanogaster]
MDNIGCNESEGIESRNSRVMGADTLHLVEGNMGNNAKARYYSPHRDRRPRHMLRWTLRELGRSFVFL